VAGQFLAGPQGVGGGHAVAVGHALLHFGDVLVGQREVVGHHVGQVEQEGGDGVDLVGLERLGLFQGMARLM
jgi:hypothetical protein